MRRTVFALAGLLVVLSALPGSASASVKWLCGPAVKAKSNPCLSSFKTTVFSSWGSTPTTAAPKAARTPKIDCFYV